jgi:hypothetical protein
MATCVASRRPSVRNGHAFSRTMQPCPHGGTRVLFRINAEKSAIRNILENALPDAFRRLQKTASARNLKLIEAARLAAKASTTR